MDYIAMTLWALHGIIIFPSLSCTNVGLKWTKLIRSRSGIERRTNDSLYSGVYSFAIPHRQVFMGWQLTQNFGIILVKS